MEMVNYYEEMTTEQLIALLSNDETFTLRQGLIIAVILEKRIPKQEK